MITAVAESDAGFYVRQIKGPAKGLMQIKPATERETLDWLRARRPEDYARIKGLRMPARLSVHEMQANTPYCIAMAYWLYRWRRVDPAKMDRAAMVRAYKRAFNTAAGRATVEGVEKKLEAFNVK